MDIVKFFGDTVGKLNSKNPDAARVFLQIGWEAMNLKFKFLPDKRLIPSDRYLSTVMMDAMLAPLRDPDNSAIVSIFTPCELLQEVGLHPYNAEAFSSYITASRAEQEMVQVMDCSGISETLCSYHKIFGGAAESGLMPKPRCIVHTNLICDANLVSFKRLARIYGVDLFYIDVPVRVNEESVAYVERQLHDLATFLEDQTGRRIDEDRLRQRVKRSKLTLEAIDAAQKLKADKDIPTDLVSPLYCGMANNLLLGTPEEQKFAFMMLDDVQAAPPKRGKHIYWMHTLPFWSDTLYEQMAFSDKVQISGDELGHFCSSDFDPDRPYEAMARRMVYNNLNGPVMRRIEAGIENARDV
ncbi:MAG: 2-hydroxyacyl-CoA dehydratase, partial [Coriobacteriales bacterium]